MATPDMSSELADLRDQLHQLELERAKELKPAASATKAAETEPDDLVAEKATEAGNWFEELEELEAEEVLERIRAAAGEKLTELNEELKDIKPSTLLMIFGAGVVLGRLTS